MSKRSVRRRTEITFDDACDALQRALAGSMRARILDALAIDDDFSRGTIALRNAMRSHIFPTGGEPLRLNRVVQSLDTRARRIGLHVLESWDYKAHRFAGEITPVLMLDRSALAEFHAERRRAAASVLLDHYFMSVLGLLAVHAWEAGDPNENLDRASELLNALEGRGGEGCRFVGDVETLLLTAVSQYHPEEDVYALITRRFDQLTDPHRRRMALACAAVLAGHLRWGLKFMYGRDIGKMREDNVVDYPLIIYGLLELLRDYDDQQDRPADDPVRAATVEGILNGLTADPTFVTQRTPAWLLSHREEHGEMRERVLDRRQDLLADFVAHQPPLRAYSPLGFDANFLCNTVVAMVGHALAEPGTHPPLNALFTRLPGDYTCEAAERRARSLMDYAVKNRIATEAPLIMYDQREAAHAFNVTNAALREARDAPVTAV